MIIYPPTICGDKDALLDHLSEIGLSTQIVNQAQDLSGFALQLDSIVPPWKGLTHHKQNYLLPDANVKLMRVQKDILQLFQVCRIHYIHNEHIETDSYVHEKKAQEPQTEF